MPHSSTIRDSNFNTDVARLTAPEDVRVGDYLALLTETYQYPTYFWCTIDSGVMPPQEPVLLKCKPSPEDGPYKVLSICLPLIFVERPDQRTRLIDVRQCELAKVAPEFARCVFKRRKPSTTGKKNKRKKKKSKGKASRK